jgi:hypothetical protein
MRAVAALISILALALGLGACGETDDTTPVACLEGPAPYLKALEGAPQEAELPGGVHIGECLVGNQTGGDLAQVGSAMVAAATKLNAEARAEPGGKANLELGYLLGAAQHGAEETEGIHAELIRRLTAAASYSLDNRPLSAEFKKTYREGFDAAGNAG